MTTRRARERTFVPSVGFSAPTSVARPGATGGGPTLPRPFDIAPDGEHFVIIVRPDGQEGVVGAAPPIKFVLNWSEELKAKVPVK